MALLLEWWELPVLFRWTFVKQDYKIREILELKSTTETCKSTFSLVTIVSYRSQFCQPFEMAHDPNYLPGCFRLFTSTMIKRILSGIWRLDHIRHDLALINRAGSLYGRILTEEVSTDRTHDRGQDSPIQTDLARLIRCLLYGENKNNLINSFNVTSLY